MNIAMTKMSSKGQVVIPSEMRTDFNAGDKILIIRNKDQLIMKKASQLDETLKEELEFAKKTEEAWEKYEKGEFKSMDSEDFLKEIKKW